MTGEERRRGWAPDRDGAPALRASHADRDRVVDVLRVAAGDGMITAEELDERLEIALSAKTRDELAALTADLPVDAATETLSVPSAKEVIRVRQHGGSARRTGRWVVPERLVIEPRWSEVTLDFTEAVISRNTLHIELNMRGGRLVLMAPPNIEVNADELSARYARVQTGGAVEAGTPVVLRVRITGRVAHGRVIVRRPGSILAQWMRRDS